MFERLFDLYRAFMDATDSIMTANDLFIEQLEIMNESYAQAFQLRVYERYYSYLSDSKELDKPNAQRELLRRIMIRNIAPSFIDELITVVLAGIPIENLSWENNEIVVSIMDYHKNQHINGRLLLIMSGTLLSKANSKPELVNAVKHVHALTGGVSIDLVGVSDTDIVKYMGWIVPQIYNCCDTANDLLLCHKQFSHTRISSRRFIGICATEAFREGKGDKEFSSILVFLEFLFNAGSDEDRQDTGEILGKLNKQKLESLDGIVKATFIHSKLYLTQWDEIRGIATKTNPLSGFFKRR